MKKESKTIRVDAKNKTFGRLASDVAAYVRGKKEVDFQPHIISNVYVVIQNLEQVKFSGKKVNQKKYHTHSMHPGGYKVKLLSDVFSKNPKKTFLLTVQRMLPENKHRKELLKHISFE